MNGAKTNYSGAYCINPSPYESTSSPYNLREMSKYLKQSGKAFGDMTDKEKEMFVPMIRRTNETGTSGLTMDYL